MKHYHKNPRTITEKQIENLRETLPELGDLGGIVHDLNSDEVIGGNQRIRAMGLLGVEPVIVERYDPPNAQGTVAVGYYEVNGEQFKYRAVMWTPRQCEKANVIANKAGGSWDIPLLASGFEMPDLLEWGFEEGELIGWPQEEPAEDPGAQLDKAAELQEKWGVCRNDLWIIESVATPGKYHRVMCGDSTSGEDVGRLMGGERAALCHADPPYGMGKEKDGIENDNLYREKLDTFQMQWWRVCRPCLEDNASAYIWGNAENLWRLWYAGGLKDSERLTLRNEIVWDKAVDGENPTMLVTGVPLKARRMFHPTERCLFFMLGEQGFNNNADNYWDGWEDIRAALAADCETMGWGAKDIERICGVGMFGHWFTKSQWTFIPEAHYKKLQAAAREHDAFKREHDAFKREHDDLKREFYATRAYFDNTHDNMTDVWQFQRVTGENRNEHATPKPVEMIVRAIKSSTQGAAIVIEPFLGSGTTAVAAEHVGRLCRGMEIHPPFVSVTLERLAGMGLEPQRVTQ